ncbi:MAG: hypothetical protein KDA96_04385, partial [Planctomycetaceae bacterium]|nr:hypothetical protein [Planctomycetaceae bacterium]
MSRISRLFSSLLRSPSRTTRRRNLPRRAGSERRGLPAITTAEILELRTLLSVTPLSEPEVAALRDVVGAVDGFGERLEDLGDFTKSLPLIDRGIGDMVDISGAFHQTFVGPIQDYLNTASPTVEGLQAAVQQVIDNVSGITGSFSSGNTSDELSYTIDATFMREVAVELDLAEQFSGDLINIQGTLAATLTFTFDFNLTFGFDRTVASISDGVFVSLADHENTVTASIAVNTTDPVQASVGFLGVTLVNPTAALNLTAEFDTTSQNVTLADLSSGDLKSLVDLTSSGDFDLTLPIQTTLAGVNVAGAKVQVHDAMLFDSTAPEFTFAGPDLDSFRTISPNGLVSALSQAANVLNEVDVFDIVIPFTGGKHLSEILNIGHAFASQIIDPSTRPDSGSEAGFGTVQQFISMIADAATYSSSSRTLEFTVSFDHIFDVVSLATDFGSSLGNLNDFQLTADASLNVDAELQAKFKIGIVLAQPGATFNPDGDGVFGLEDDTNLSELNGGQGIPTVSGNDLRITLRDGTTADIDLSTVVTIGDLRTVLTSGTLSGRLEVLFDESTDLITRGRFNQGLIVVDRTTGTDNDRLRMEMLNGSLAAAALGMIGTGTEGILRNADGSVDELSHGIRTGQLHGQSLADNVYFSPVSAETPMFEASASLTATLNGAAKFGFIELGLGTDTQDATAVGRLAASFTAPDPNSDGRVTVSEIIDVASSLSRTVVATNGVNLTETYSGNVIIDLLKSDGSPSQLSVPFSISAGATLRSVVTQLNNALVTLNGSNPDAQRIEVASIGDALTFRLADSDGIASMTVNSGLPASATGRLGLTEPLSVYVLKPDFSGSAHFEIPYEIDLFSLNISGALPPENQVISFDIPDLTDPHFDLADALSIDLEGIGDHLNRLKSLDLQTIIETLQGALDFLKGIEGFQEAPFLNQPLPLLNTDLKSILNIADVFGDFIIQLKTNPAQGLGQFDELFEDLLGIPENSKGQSGLPDFSVSVFPQLNAGKSFSFHDGGTLRNINLGDATAFDKTWFGGAYPDLTSFLRSPLVQGDDTDAVELSLDTSSGFANPALRIDLQFGVGNGFGFNVDPLGLQVPVS